LERIQIAPMAWITNGATWDEATRTLQVSATTTFQSNATGNYKIALVLTEDEVTGTGSGYAQANAYAGGGNGAMGGYEDLPSPVPASQMVYDHVARAISPSFDGLSNAFTGNMDAGDATTHNFTFVLPAEWEVDQMHIVAMVIAADGTIDNAFSSTVDEAVANGFISGTAVVGITETGAPDAKVQIFPNPANDNAHITLQLQNTTTIAVEVYNAAGQLVASKNYGEWNGAIQLPIQMTDWECGLYKVKVITGATYSVHNLIKH